MKRNYKTSRGKEIVSKLEAPVKKGMSQGDKLIKKTVIGLDPEQLKFPISD